MAIGTSNGAGIPLTPLTTSSTVNVSYSGAYSVNDASAATITIPVPQDDGRLLTFICQRAANHIFSFTGAKLRTGTAASATTATVDSSGGVTGSGLSVVSYGGLWFVLSKVGTINYA
jgi:hypothetical protein